MGLLDGVMRIVGDVAAGLERTIDQVGGGHLAMSFAKFHPGGLQAFLDRLRADGHGAAVDSWLGAGENRPVPVEAIARLLDPDVAERMAVDLRVRPERVPVSLAAFLPAAVDAASPEGRLPPQHDYATQVRARTPIDAPAIETPPGVSPGTSPGLAP